MSFSSTMKRWGNSTIEDVSREITRIHADPKYKDTRPDSLHLYTKYARKKLHDLALVINYKWRREMKRRRPCARCVWREEEEAGGWATGCGETFCFEYEGPRQHLHYFCPNCGKPIDEVKYKRRKYERA